MKYVRQFSHVIVEVNIYMLPNMSTIICIIDYRILWAIVKILIFLWGYPQTCMSILVQESVVCAAKLSKHSIFFMKMWINDKYIGKLFLFGSWIDSFVAIANLLFMLYSGMIQWSEIDLDTIFFYFFVVTSITVGLPIGNYPNCTRIYVRYENRHTYENLSL